MTSTISELNHQTPNSTSSEERTTNSVEESERTKINQQMLIYLNTKLQTAGKNTIAHKIMARFWGKWDLWINLPNTALAAISGASALSNIDGYGRVLVGVLGLIVALLTSINTFLKPSKRSNEHVQFASRYSAIYNRLDWFRSMKWIEEEQEGQNLYRPIKEEKDNDSTQELYSLLKEVITEFDELNIKAPILYDWAKNAAKERMKG